MPTGRRVHQSHEWGLRKACACQGNKGQIKGQLVMFCIQWKLVHIIAAFEMCKALFPLPESFLSLRIVLMNWKGHDICEELKKKSPSTPGLGGSSQHKGLWEPGLSSRGSPGMWLCLPFGWHVELI